LQASFHESCKGQQALYETMNINHVTSFGVMPSAEARPAGKEDSMKGLPSVDISSAAGMERDLKYHPDLRADRLEEMRSATRLLTYPPEELIQGVSKLLAKHLVQPED
jgi:hypothetical protein